MPAREMDSQERLPPPKSDRDRGIDDHHITRCERMKEVLNRIWNLKSPWLPIVEGLTTNYSSYPYPTWLYVWMFERWGLTYLLFPLGVRRTRGQGEVVEDAPAIQEKNPGTSLSAMKAGHSISATEPTVTKWIVDESEQDAGGDIEGEDMKRKKVRDKNKNRSGKQKMKSNASPPVASLVSTPIADPPTTTTSIITALSPQMDNTGGWSLVIHGRTKKKAHNKELEPLNNRHRSDQVPLSICEYSTGIETSKQEKFLDADIEQEQYQLEMYHATQESMKAVPISHADDLRLETPCPHMDKEAVIENTTKSEIMEQVVRIEDPETVELDANATPESCLAKEEGSIPKVIEGDKISHLIFIDKTFEQAAKLSNTLDPRVQSSRDNEAMKDSNESSAWETDEKDFALQLDKEYTLVKRKQRNHKAKTAGHKNPSWATSGFTPKAIGEKNAGRADKAATTKGLVDATSPAKPAPWINVVFPAVVGFGTPGEITCPIQNEAIKTSSKYSGTIAMKQEFDTASNLVIKNTICIETSKEEVECVSNGDTMTPETASPTGEENAIIFSVSESRDSAIALIDDSIESVKIGETMTGATEALAVYVSIESSDPGKGVIGRDCLTPLEKEPEVLSEAVGAVGAERDQEGATRVSWQDSTKCETLEVKNEGDPLPISKVETEPAQQFRISSTSLTEGEITKFPQKPCEGKGSTLWSDTAEDPEAEEALMDEYHEKLLVWDKERKAKDMASK